MCMYMYVVNYQKMQFKKKMNEEDFLKKKQ